MVNELFTIKHSDEQVSYPIEIAVYHYSDKGQPNVAKNMPTFCPPLFTISAKGSDEKSIEISLQHQINLLIQKIFQKMTRELKIDNSIAEHKILLCNPSTSMKNVKKSSLVPENFCLGIDGPIGHINIFSESIAEIKSIDGKETLLKKTITLSFFVQKNFKIYKDTSMNNNIKINYTEKLNIQPNTKINTVFIDQKPNGTVESIDENTIEIKLKTTFTNYRDIENNHFEMNIENGNLHIITNNYIQKQQIMQQAAETPEGRVALSYAMLEPIQQNLNDQSLPRLFLLTEKIDDMKNIVSEIPTYNTVFTIYNGFISELNPIIPNSNFFAVPFFKISEKIEIPLEFLLVKKFGKIDDIKEKAFESILQQENKYFQMLIDSQAVTFKDIEKVNDRCLNQKKNILSNPFNKDIIENNRKIEFNVDSYTYSEKINKNTIYVLPIETEFGQFRTFNSIQIIPCDNPSQQTIGWVFTENISIAISNEKPIKWILE